MKAVHEENLDAEMEEAEEQTEQTSEEAVETTTEPKNVNGPTLTFPNLDDIPNKERPPRVGKPPTRRGGMKKLRRERECLLAAGAVLGIPDDVPTRMHQAQAELQLMEAESIMPQQMIHGENKELVKVLEAVVKELDRLNRSWNQRLQFL